MDQCVQAVATTAPNTDTNTCLQYIEALQPMPTTVQAVHLIFVLNEHYFSNLKHIKRRMLQLAQPSLQSLKLQHNCSINCADLQQVGIAKIMVQCQAALQHEYFSLTEHTACHIVDVKLQSLWPKAAYVQLPMFEQAQEQLLLLFKCAEQESGAKWQPVLNALVTGASGVGKTTFVTHLLQQQQCNCFCIDAAKLMGQYAGDTQAKLRHIFEAAKYFKTQFQASAPTVILIEQLDLLCPANSHKDANMQRISTQLLSLLDELHVQQTGIICVAIANTALSLNVLARRAGRFEKEIHIAPPNKEERYELLQALNSSQLPLTEQMLQDMAVQTRGYVSGDLELLLRNLCMAHAANATICLPHVINKTIQKLQAGSLRAADVNTYCGQDKFSNLGGMQHLKRQLQVHILGGMQQAHIYGKFGLSLPKGVLLYGPPGCAKTSIVKCLAGEAHMTLISTSGAEIYSPYVGCAEQFIVKLFDTARKNTPCLIFLDEIDSLVGKRSTSSSGGGGEVQMRILSTLLTEIDGISSGGKEILVVAATNRPNMIDDALMRPGRFDKLIHVPPPDYESRLAILQLKAQTMPFDDTVNLLEIATITHNFAGADVCNLCNEAALKCMQRDMNACQINALDFEHVLNKYKSSLSQEQIDWYANFEKGVLKC